MIFDIMVWNNPCQEILRRVKWVAIFTKENGDQYESSSFFYYCSLYLTKDDDGKNVALAVIFVTLLSLICDWFTAKVLRVGNGVFLRSVIYDMPLYHQYMPPFIESWYIFYLLSLFGVNRICFTSVIVYFA